MPNKLELIQAHVFSDARVVRKIADFFNVTTDYILGRDYKDLESGTMLDVTGLTPSQVEHIRQVVDDLRESKS